MKAKLIKTDDDHRRALSRMDVLMGAVEGSDEADELELLATLVELYEAEAFPIDLPGPVEAILFRVEQLGLTRRDLEPCIGSKSKVSEVLAGKRPLSLRMIRELHGRLGIPADCLVGRSGGPVAEPSTDLDWRAFPVRAIVDRGWVDVVAEGWTDLREHAEDIVLKFLEPVPARLLASPAFFRSGAAPRRRFDPYALIAWQCRVLVLGAGLALSPARRELLNEEFVQTLVRLSVFDDGPLLAREYLAKHGIGLVVLGHLPRTQTDGAAMLSADGRPIIALTLRFDRLDHFWFSLLHEVGHVMLHLFEGHELFIDDEGVSAGTFEEEADAFARAALNPGGGLMDVPRGGRAAEALVRRRAQWQGVHPAIVAGRVRYEQGNYRLLPGLVGQGQVRKCFPGMAGGCV